MDYTIRKVEVDLIALEGHLATLDAMRAELGERKVSQGLALECDALMHANRGDGSLISLRYKYDATSKDYTVALEGIISTVWEHIKMIFAKIVEYVKKFWAWITGKSNSVTPEKVEAAESSMSNFEEVWETFLREVANPAAAKVKEAGQAVGDVVRDASQATSRAVHKGLDAVDAVKDKALGIKHPDENTPPDPNAERDKFRHIDQLDVKYGKDSKLLKGDNDATNPDASTEKKPSHSFRNGKWVEDGGKSIKVTPTGKTGNPGVDAATHRTRDTMREVDEQNKKVNDMLKDHPSQNGDVTKQKVGAHQLQKLESDLADTEGKIASIQSEIDEAKKAGQTGDAISKLESKKKWYQESADIQKDSVEKFRKQIEAYHSKPATEGISLEDAGMRQKPAEILNAVALSMKSQFLSGLPRPETLILFSPNYAAELEKLAREFARLKPIDALMKRYTAIDGWLGKAMGEAARIDAIKDINEYRPRLEDFRKSFEAEVNHIHEMPDDAEQLASDISRFHASRDDHGSNAFAIETPQTGDQLLHVASITDTTFRVVRAVTAEIKDAGSELKRLEDLFEGLSTKINTASAGGEGNSGARDFVAHTLQSEVRLVSSKVRSIVQGLSVFTNYYSDAHRAVSRYQKFVIKVMEAALHEMKGDHEFQEEQLRSLLAKLRDANLAFERIK
jgi:hypothetical protein